MYDGILEETIGFMKIQFEHTVRYVVSKHDYFVLLVTCANIDIFLRFLDEDRSNSVVASCSPKPKH